MKIIVKAEAQVIDPPAYLEDYLINELTVTNPHFSKKIAMGLSPWGIKQYFEYFSYDKDTKTYFIPVGFLPQLLNQYLAKGGKEEEVDIDDQRITNKVPTFFKSIKPSFTLRDYQKDITNAMSDRTVGVIQAKPGSGKTISFISHIIDTQEATLILVNTKELAEQTFEALVNKGNIPKKKLGFVGSGKFILAPITVGIIQTFVYLLKEKSSESLKQVQEFFGQVIVDETHIVPALTYYKVISALPAKRKYGFSGTPFREDGLTKVIHFGVGPTIHIVPEETVNKHLVLPSYKQIPTDFSFLYLESSDYQPMLSLMAEDEERTKLIMHTFNKNPNISSCFLCLRLTQVDLLHKLVPNSVKLTSKMKKSEREKAMEKLRSGEKLHVISTYGLFSTGIDIPSLETLYLCAPIQSRIKLKQSAGRLMRPSPGKTSATIIDFVDIKVGLLASQSKKRGRILRNL